MGDHTKETPDFARHPVDPTGEVVGYVHSYETFGTVDGPGVRFVVFTQGCPLRCAYCHNPDTRSFDPRNTRYKVKPLEVLEKIKHYLPYYKKGGVTLTGGEPLAQPVFVKELLKLCKELGLHTAVDTSGFYLNDEVRQALKYTDLVLLDIKCIDDQVYEKLTHQKLEPTLNFAKELVRMNVSTWIRYVLVPGITDEDTLIARLAEYLVEELKGIVKRVEVLPYHTLGILKYAAMKLDYPLKGVQPPSKERVDNAKKIFQSWGLEVW